MPLETEDTRPEVCFTTAPGLDLLAACHLVAEPSHHAFAQSWVDRVMEGACGEVREAVRSLSVLPMAGLELADLFTPAWNLMPDEVLAEIASASREEVQQSLLETTVGPDQVAKAGLDAAVRHALEDRPWVLSGRPEAVALAITDPLGLRDAVLALGLHLSCSFAEKLDALAVPYKDTLAEIERDYADSGLSPLDFAEREMGKAFLHRGPYRVLYFIPSWFLAPHKLRVWDKERCFVILGRAANVMDAGEKADELSNRFRLLADRNRLLILHMLMVKPHYGRQMAPRLGLTPATVSHHLDALYQAGLVDVRTAGKVKYFSLNRAKLEEVLALFGSFITNR